MSHIKNKFPKLAFALVNHCLPQSSTNLFKREMASNQAKILMEDADINYSYLRFLLMDDYIQSNCRIQWEPNSEFCKSCKLLFTYLIF